MVKGGLEGKKPFQMQGDSHVADMWDNGLPKIQCKAVQCDAKGLTRKQRWLGWIAANSR